MALLPLRLKKTKAAGHLWVFSNEVDTTKTSLNAFEAGQPVKIQDSKGEAIGNGYVNPHSLICARLVSRDAEHVLGKSLLVHRLNIALSLRVGGQQPAARMGRGLLGCSDQGATESSFCTSSGLMSNPSADN